MKFSIRGLFSFEFSLNLPRMFWPRHSVSPAAYELERFHIAGFQFHEGPELIEHLEPGCELSLVREPKNPHDQRAVALYSGDAHIGYVPRDRNRTIARMLDQGAPLFCRITDVDPEEDPWRAVEVAVSVGSEGLPEDTTPAKKPPLFVDL
jgi:hypothetical protein